jgi:hypothetical protein
MPVATCAVRSSRSANATPESGIVAIATPGKMRKAGGFS